MRYLDRVGKVARPLLPGFCLGLDRWSWAKSHVLSYGKGNLHEMGMVKGFKVLVSARAWGVFFILVW